MMDQEFNLGDNVIYRPYEKKLPGVVKKIYIDIHDEIRYNIVGDGISTHTTGMSIIDSKYYIPFEETEDYKRFKSQNR